MLDTKPYVVQKFEAGEVKFEAGAAGWKMPDGEFRPLMSDAMKELHDAGYVDDACMLSTATAREEYTQRTLAEYRVAQANRTAEQIAEERFEARAAMGPGVEMVNIFTGERYIT